MQKKQHHPGNPKIQTKLKVDSPDSPLEKEAERVADQIMMSPSVGNAALFTETAQGVQPTVAPRRTEEIQMMSEIEEEEEGIQMTPAGEGLTMAVPPEDEEIIVQPKLDGTKQKEASDDLSFTIQNAHSEGHPLPEHVNSEFSRKMGIDFKDVRTHQNSQSTHINRQLGARAFTYGNNIFFNQGEFNTGSTKGKHLLAHELTHVVQQNNTSPSMIQLEEDDSSRPPEINIEEELSSTQSALAAIHEQMRTSIFDWRVSQDEARRVFQILQEQHPAVLLRTLQTMRISDRGRRFYEALSDSDRERFDEFAAVFSTDTGYLANGDTIRIVVYASTRQTQPEFELDLRISSEGVRPFFLPHSLPIRNLLPRQAANLLARAYREEQIFVEPRVRLLVTERGSAYAPRHGETSQSVWFEAVERMSSEEAAMMDKRQQFLDYIGLADISRSPEIVNASLRYLNWISSHYNTPEFLERSPVDLWRWALEEAMRPLPESPIQPFLDLYRRMSHRLESARDEDRSVLQGALNRFLDWIDQHMTDPGLSSTDPVEIWTSLYSRSFDLHLQNLRETTFRRVIEERRQQEEERSRAAREQRWEEHYNMALRLWGYSTRNFPYLIPIPSEGRDILVTGDPVRQAVLNSLADELLSWATDNMFSPNFLNRSPEAVLVDLLEGGFSELLSEANRFPLQSESIDRREIMPGRALASFGETVATGLLVIGLVGAAVGAGIVSAPVAAVLLIGAAGAAGIASYMERREEIERQSYDVPISDSLLHSAGDVVGLSQLIEGISGERLGTGRQLGSIERSEQLGTGSGGTVLLLTGSRAYRYGQVRGQRFRLSRPGATPPGPEGGSVPNPRDTPPAELTRPGPYQNPGPLETQVRNALDQSLRTGFDEWMAEIRGNGGNPETVLNRMPANRRNAIARRRAEDFTQQFLERLRQEEIRIRSMDNPLNPMMRHTEQAIPGNDGVLLMFNEQRPAAHEIQQAIRLFQRTGEPVRLFGDTASGRSYPGIDGTIGSPPRPLSLKHGDAAAHPNFARFQAEEALISARNNGYTHVEVQIEMQGSRISEIQAAWESPSLRPGQAQPRPVFDAGHTISRIVIQGADGTWIIDPAVGGRALPGIVVPTPEERE